MDGFILQRGGGVGEKKFFRSKGDGWHGCLGDFGALNLGEGRVLEKKASITNSHTGTCCSSQHTAQLWERNEMHHEQAPFYMTNPLHFAHLR